MIAVGFGRVLVWQGGSLWIGISHKGASHAHHGLQIGVALDGDLMFESQQEWRTYRLAVIPSKVTHALDGGGRLAAQIFVEPQSPEGRILTENYCSDGGINDVPFELIARSADQLLSSYLSGASAEELKRDAHAIIADLTAGSTPRTVTNPRILTAIELMEQRLDTMITLRNAAALVHLSPGRFRHLFVEETGTPLRPYLLWLRLSKAVDAISRGDSITSAAHMAGFSDSAHLTRIFRRMFGLAPSSLKFDAERPKHDLSKFVETVGRNN